MGQLIFGPVSDTWRLATRSIWLQSLVLFWGAWQEGTGVWFFWWCVMWTTRHCFKKQLAAFSRSLKGEERYQRMSAKWVANNVQRHLKQTKDLDTHFTSRCYCLGSTAVMHHCRLWRPCVIRHVSFASGMLPLYLISHTGAGLNRHNSG